MSSSSSKKPKRYRFSDELIAGLAIQPHQLELARQPSRPTRAALAEFDQARVPCEQETKPPAAAPNPGNSTMSSGSFKDFDRLLDQLGTPMVIELGKPLPRERHLPRRVGRCPAAHNQALFEKAAS